MVLCQSSQVVDVIKAQDTMYFDSLYAGDKADLLEAALLS